MITEQDSLCYCILIWQYVKRHYVAGYLLVKIIIHHTHTRHLNMPHTITLILYISILLKEY